MHPQATGYLLTSSSYMLWSYPMQKALLGITKQTRSKVWRKLKPTSRREKNEHTIRASTQTMQVWLTVMKGSLKKNHWWGWAWWPMPVIPATGEPEARLLCMLDQPALQWGPVSKRKQTNNNKRGQRDYWWTQTHKLLVEKDQNYLLKKKKRERETDGCSSCQVSLLFGSSSQKGNLNVIRTER